MIQTLLADGSVALFCASSFIEAPSLHYKLLLGMDCLNAAVLIVNALWPAYLLYQIPEEEWGRGIDIPVMQNFAALVFFKPTDSAVQQRMAGVSILRPESENDGADGIKPKTPVRPPVMGVVDFYSPTPVLEPPVNTKGRPKNGNSDQAAKKMRSKDNLFIAIEKSNLAQSPTPLDAKKRRKSQKVMLLDSQPTITVQEIFWNRDLKKAFSKFLAAEFAMESFLFVEAIGRFRDLTEEKHVTHHIIVEGLEKIVNEFLKPSSVNEVNLPGPIIRKIQSNIEKVRDQSILEDDLIEQFDQIMIGLKTNSPITPSPLSAVSSGKKKDFSEEARDIFDEALKHILEMLSSNYLRKFQNSTLYYNYLLAQAKGLP